MGKCRLRNFCKRLLLHLQVHQLLQLFERPGEPSRKEVQKQVYPWHFALGDELLCGLTNEQRGQNVARLRRHHDEKCANGPNFRGEALRPKVWSKDVQHIADFQRIRVLSVIKSCPWIFGLLLLLRALLLTLNVARFSAHLVAFFLCIVLQGFHKFYQHTNCLVVPPVLEPPQDGGKNGQCDLPPFHHRSRNATHEKKLSSGEDDR